MSNIGSWSKNGFDGHGGWDNYNFAFDNGAKGWGNRSSSFDGLRNGWERKKAAIERRKDEADNDRNNDAPENEAPLPDGDLDLVDESDSGASNDDYITNVTNPVMQVPLNGDVQVGDVVELLLNGESFGNQLVHTVDAGDLENAFVEFKVPDGDLGADGVKLISARLTDAAGNSSTTEALSITLDTTPPTGGVPRAGDPVTSEPPNTDEDDEADEDDIVEDPDPTNPQDPDEDEATDEDDVVEDPDPTNPQDPDEDETADGDDSQVDLTHSTTAIKTTHDGQVIENLDLYVKSGDAITVTHDDVIIRNCRIHHEEGNGVFVRGASNVTIEGSEVINSSPPTGINPETSSEINNIYTLNAPNLTVDNVTVRDGSTGMYLVDSPGANISNVDGYDFHGPFPRGQFVQFNRSGESSLTDFYVHNDPNNSHPEDNISVYHSPNVSISNGVIDGNNSETGVGVMFEGNSTGGRVTNVDAINQGNGAFSSYASDVVFESTRSFDGINEDQGRGHSSSNGLIWNISSDGVSILDSTYTNPGNPDNIAWKTSRAVVAEIDEDPHATPMAPISNQFDWM